MLSVNIFFISFHDLFHVWYNNQDGSCSFSSSYVENNLYHRNEMCPTELVKADYILSFHYPLMNKSSVLVQ